MTLAEAQQKAQALFGSGVVLRRINGIARICRPASDEDQAKTPRPPITREGLSILGSGCSWLEALRRAAAPVIAAEREKAQMANEKRMKDMREAEAEALAFSEFLREKFAAEYEAWTDARKTPADASASNP